LTAVFLAKRVGGKLLFFPQIVVLENGLQAKRIMEACRLAGHEVKSIPVDTAKLEHILTNFPDIAGVIAVHCETATGKVNPIEDLGKLTKKFRDGTKATTDNCFL